ncbi:hypothetical protein ACFU53_13735 [Streptomyces sp. NPDC057474]|uniref:hypothetical protein n=1 Tax=Streptomyces sp. NPDC057474 TaxID=3346144 RepID=UPI00367388BD
MNLFFSGTGNSVLLCFGVNFTERQERTCMCHTSKFRLVVTVIVGLLSGASAVFGVIANGDRQLNAVFLVLGGLAAAAAAGLTFLVQGHQSVPAAHLPADKRADVIFQAGVHPVAENLASLASMSTDDPDLRGGINRGLVQTAAHLMEGADCVAAFYALAEDPDNKGAERLAKRVTSTETAELPAYYKVDRGTGSYLLDIATGTKDRYVKNYEEDPEKWRIDLIDGYTTALFVPVRAGAIPKGILIVQAVEAGCLEDGNERKKYGAIAHLIGANQAVADLTAYVRSLPAQANGSLRKSPSVNGAPADGHDPEKVSGADADSIHGGE